MKLVALIFVLAGGVLPISAAAWAYVTGRARLGVLDTADATIRKVNAENHDRMLEGLDQIEINDRLRAVGIPVTTWNDASIMRIVIEREIVRSNLLPLRGPALLALTGVMAGTVGGALALCLPAS